MEYLPRLKTILVVGDLALDKTIIVVQHGDGSTHVGTPKPHSPHIESGGEPKYYRQRGTGHVGENKQGETGEAQ